MNSIWWHIAETARNNMKKDVSLNRLHHEHQLPSLGGCSSTLLHLPMFPTKIMWFCPFYFSVWKISGQLDVRSRWKSLGTCNSQQHHEYVLGAALWWGVTVLKWWNSAGRQDVHLVVGTIPLEEEKLSISSVCPTASKQ